MRKIPRPQSLLDLLNQSLPKKLAILQRAWMIRSASRSRRIHLGELVSLVDEASTLAKQNQELLRKAIEHLSQGISVVDQNQNLVAWNRRYQELFDYPDELLTVGRPVADLFRTTLQTASLVTFQPMSISNKLCKNVSIT